VLLPEAIQRARGSLLWERLWPAIAVLATALGLFLAFSGRPVDRTAAARPRIGLAFRVVR